MKPQTITDTEIWIIAPPGDLDAITAAIVRLGYVCYSAPPVPGIGTDRRHRTYLRVLCRTSDTTQAT